MKKNGNGKRRTWRKLHLAVDIDTHEIITAEMTLVNVGDSEVLPTLLNPQRWQVVEVSADGAYDTKECYKVLKNKKINYLFHREKCGVMGRRTSKK